MKILVAGATGAIGRPLVRQALEQGHEVVAMTRDMAKAADVDAPGAHWVVCDALDPAAVDRVVAKHRPEAVVAQLTNLPQEFKPRRLEKWYARNNEVRFQGTRNLLAAAQEHGVDTFVAQSSAFWYRPTPGDVKTETDPLWEDAPEPIGEAVRTMVRTERLVQDAAGVRPVLLRYAAFYGPGTWFARDGTVGRLVQRRQYPLVGDGTAVASFIHVEDAAAATLAALDKDVRGVYAIADDEPAPAKEWLPDYAAALGAKPPRPVPKLVARMAIGSALVEYTLNQRGADNTKAKRELGWRPRYGSWRQGFREGL